MKRLLKILAAASGLAILAACGGGGGSAGTSPFGSGGGGTGGTTAGPGSSLLLSISSTTATAAAPATVTATLRNSTGAVLSGQVISFSTSGGLGKFNVSTALTDSNGQAVVMVSPATSSSNGADLVVAKTSVGTTSLTGTIGFQVTPGGSSTLGVPSITVSLSSTSVTSVTPATLTAVVRDATGAAIAGQVVSFQTAGTGIGAFSVSSALSDATGTVTTQVTPASTSANGADLAIAQATISGSLVTGSIGFSVASTGSPSVGTPSISITLSTTTVTTATPATVTAVVKDATGAGVVGQVVRFSTVNGLGTLAVSSALTDGTGSASTTLTATSATQSGADQVLATSTVNGTSLQASQGFQLTAASVAIASVTADTSSLGAYGQTGVQVMLSGTVPGTPVIVTITSACLAAGKASLTPPTATTTNGVASFTYRDLGCGATTVSDTLRASIAGSASTGSIAIAIGSPAATSINFVSALPTSIFLKGSGFVETSIITFKVLDIAGNGLPGQNVLLQATTLAGGLTLDGVSGDPPPKISDSSGLVQVRINSGTVPTPVRIKASLVSIPTITTVSSSLAIAVGLPSQLNFSLSQGTRNIEGFDIDGTVNSYNIIASDRLGNPVPAGTAVNFVTEGGQVEAIKMTTIDSSGNARATANFVSSAPRPADGRITILAYALGEESFLDQNGNNVWDAGEPFQDLGSLYLDRLFNGHYNAATDQFIALSLPGAVTAPCAPITSPLLGLDVSIPSIPSTPSFGGFVAPPVPTSCDGTWGKAYVRRAIETVLSTSASGPLWNAAPSQLYSTTGGSCPAANLTIGYNADESPIVAPFLLVGGGGAALYNATSAYSFLISDANPIRLNPMAAGTTVAVDATTGVTVKLLGGSPVPSTTEPTFATFSVAFVPGTTSGTVTLTFASPGGLTTSVNIPVFAGPPPGGAVPC